MPSHSSPEGSLGRRSLRLCMALVNVAGLLVPRHQRSDWRREWRAEIWHRSRAAAAAPGEPDAASTPSEEINNLRVRGARPRSPRGDLVARSFGAFRHAAWLRSQEWKPEMLMQDVRYALRALRRAPTFTLMALLTLGIGIGANAVVFNMLDSVLLTPYPFENPEELVTVSSTFSERPGVRGALSFPTYLEIRDSGVFDDIAVWDWEPMNLRGDDETVFIGVGQVTSSLFNVMRVEPIIGRGFSPEEDVPGQDGVVVLTESFWETQYAGDSGVIGTTIQLDGKPRVIVGVMPNRYAFPDEIQAWVPLGVTAETSPASSNWLGALARMQSGWSEEQTLDALVPVANVLEDRYPDLNRDRGIGIQSLRDNRVGSIRPFMMILLFAVGFLLLIVCANVANLLLARASAREREISVRLALGASRTRLVRQLLTESFLLSAGGLAIGFGFSNWAVNAILSTIPVELPVWIEVRTNLNDVLYMAGVALAATVIFGLVPALQATRTSVQGALSDASGRVSGGLARRMTRNSLVVAEVALSLVLLTGAGLMARSFTQLSNVDPGFETENRLMATMQMPRGKYTSGEMRVNFYREMMDRLAAMPGVASAGAISRMPIRGSSNTQWFMYEGQDPDEARSNPNTLHNAASPDYFDTMGIPVLAGRAFAATDTAAAGGVVLVNDEFAARYFAEEGAVGKRITFDAQNWLEIVGVVGSVRHFGLDQEPQLQAYVPYEQSPQGRLSIVLRTQGDPAAMAPLLRDEIRSIDADQALYDLMPVATSVAEDVWEPGFFATLMRFFAVIAAGIAAVGIYGVTAYSVSRRTQELGIRMALGADQRQIVRMVILQSMLVVGIGVVIGTVLAAAQGVAMESLLYEVSGFDPATLLSVVATVLAVGFLAAWLPARRATRLDPVLALRDE